MGKAKKQKKKQHRFNPIERSDTKVEGKKPEPKPLSAHQARHLERKRLQAEAKELKRQRGKVSKAQAKFQLKAEKKALTMSLHDVKAKAAALKSEPLAKSQAAAVSTPSTFTFNLPTPVSRDTTTLACPL